MKIGLSKGLAGRRRKQKSETKSFCVLGTPDEPKQSGFMKWVHTANENGQQRRARSTIGLDFWVRGIKKPAGFILEKKPKKDIIAQIITAELKSWPLNFRMCMQTKHLFIYLFSTAKCLDNIQSYNTIIIKYNNINFNKQNSTL